MGGLLSIVTLVLYVVAIIDAVKSSLETSKKVLWIIVILILPILGAIIYYFVGRKK